MCSFSLPSPSPCSRGSPLAHASILVSLQSNSLYETETTVAGLVCGEEGGPCPAPMKSSHTLHPGLEHLGTLRQAMISSGFWLPGCQAV